MFYFSLKHDDNDKYILKLCKILFEINERDLFDTIKNIEIFTV